MGGGRSPKALGHMYGKMKEVADKRKVQAKHIEDARKNSTKPHLEDLKEIEDKVSPGGKGKRKAKGGKWCFIPYHKLYTDYLSAADVRPSKKVKNGSLSKKVPAKDDSSAKELSDDEA